MPIHLLIYQTNSNYPSSIYMKVIPFIVIFAVQVDTT